MKFISHVDDLEVVGSMEIKNVIGNPSNKTPILELGWSYPFLIVFYEKNFKNIFFLIPLLPMISQKWNTTK
jgi:hypothetical protein